MGGKAFSHLGEDAFPRIPTDTYMNLKSCLADRLKTLYAFVETPTEAPEKLDHGDVDFIVCGPLPILACSEDSADTRSGDEHNLALARVKDTLGARHAILAEGHRTSNFAVPAMDGDLELEGKFYQVDVHVCADEAEWKRILFFNAYGDLGMILGLLARAHGYTFGTKGLRTYFAQQDDTHISSFPLSDSFGNILPFFGLSMDAWVRGFATIEDVFVWVQSSRFFIPRRLVYANPAREKKAAHNKRTMYQAFLEFSHALAESASESEPPEPRQDKQEDEKVKEKIAADCIPSSQEDETKPVSEVFQEAEKPKDLKDTNKPALDRTILLQEALEYFNKKDAYDALVDVNVRRRALREKFNGTNVISWTGRSGIIVKLIMDGVRARASDDDIIKMEEDELRRLVLEVQEKLDLESDGKAGVAVA
ncbi:hypothetical protein DFH11DRAFT_182006 [Phellopilus nigrolimitatus]|nr:hypothetical protein DFH11DRAFT_182006 [Phellopilus nigrolimitatus]